MEHFINPWNSWEKASRASPWKIVCAYANMAIEAGAKNGIFMVDDITEDYMTGSMHRENGKSSHLTRMPSTLQRDDIDLSQLKPTVSFPHLPENTKTIDEVGDVPIRAGRYRLLHQRSSGRHGDWLPRSSKAKDYHDDVRAIIIPATQQIFKDCIKEGYMDIFIDAGCVVSTPTCGPCLGGHMGILAEGERCVATTNRNFVGRMGHVKSEVYLASPAVAAASCHHRQNQRTGRDHVRREQ